MMSANDLMAFSILCERDKIESLSGIREIVCGMRAFNKDAGHCGEGLIDSKYMPKLCLFIYKMDFGCVNLNLLIRAYARLCYMQLKIVCEHFFLLVSLLTVMDIQSKIEKLRRCE